MRTFLPILDGEVHPQIKQTMKEAAACPECGAALSSLVAMSDYHITRPNFVIVCRKCSHVGRFGKNLPDAIKRWNKRPGFFSAFLKKRFKR